MKVSTESLLSHLGLLDEISENDSVPIIPVYRILIDSFIKAGRLESALELHEEIPSFFPLKAASKNMYTSLIESLSHAGKVVKAFELYTDMVRMGGVAELSTFIHLIKGLININKWEEALQLSDSIVIWSVSLYLHFLCSSFGMHYGNESCFCLSKLSVLKIL